MGERVAPAGPLLALACAAQFMVVLDVAIVNVALPSIGHDLRYSVTGLQWVVNAYVLTFAGFLLLGGRMADLFGRRRVFLAGLVLFSLASLLAGVAQTSGELVAARALQGMGGAVLSPATLTIVTTTFAEGAPRDRAIGVWSAVAGAGGASGAILGGMLTSYLSWRWIFFVNVPFGIVAAVVAVLILTEARRAGADRSLDVAGAVTATAGLALLVYGIVTTDTHGWSSVHTFVLLALAAVLLAAFVLLQWRVVRSPLMPLSLFRSRAVSVANVAMALTGAAFFSMWYFLSLYLQDVHGYSPLHTGVAFLPMGVAVIVGARAASVLVSKRGLAPPLVGGLILATLGFAWLTHLRAGTSYMAGVLPGYLLATGGVGLSLTPLAAAATSGVPARQAGLASGVLNTSRQVGGSIGLAALATLATARSHHVATRLPRVALTHGFDRAFLGSAVVTLLAALAAVALPRRAYRAAVSEPVPPPASVR